MYPVAEGVHRIPLPLPGDHLHAVNVYVIEDGDRLVMIDGGMARAATTPVLEAALATIGRAPEEISDFLVTHMHRDHYTNAIAVRRRFGTRVGLGEAERAAVEACLVPDPPGLATDLTLAGAPAELIRQVDAVKPDLEFYEEPDRWLPDGADLPLTSRTLRVIATPGHTRGHVVFHDPVAGVLFAGDHVLPHITPSIGFELPRSQFPRSPLADFLDSLLLVKALPDAVLLPAHGPSGGSVHTRADELTTHHEERLAATALTVRRGAGTAAESARALRWTRRQHSLRDLDPFNQVLAILETAAHLDVLTGRGELDRRVEQGVAHYHPADFLSDT